MKKIGELGENITCKLLARKGYKILERNFSKKFGEIDIVCKKKDKIYFVEVKTSLEKPGFEKDLGPEERVDSKKLKRISKVIQIYLSENKIKDDQSWNFFVAAVIFSPKNKTARIKIIEDVVPEQS